MAIYFNNGLGKEPFQFDSVGNDWLQDMMERPQGYAHYHYLQTEKNSGIFCIDGEELLLSEGQGILIAPHVPHLYRPADRNWYTCFATFTGTLEAQLPQLLGSARFVRTEKEQAANIAACIDEAVRHFAQEPSNTGQLSFDCYRLLLQFADTPAGAAGQPAWEKYVQPVLAAIEARYMEDLTTEQLCALVYVSPQYLSRLFVRFLGCSVYEYLTSYRITKAKTLLLTDRSRKVQEIAHDVGYSDPSHFVVMFRKLTGMTPTGFRRQ